MALSCCHTYRLKLFVSAILLIFSCVCRGQEKPGTTRVGATAEDNINRISDSLTIMQEKLPVEKVYLHTDKTSYNIGDTIWFKAYVIDNVTHQPSKLSNLLYIQMDDDSTNMVDRISIRLKDGVGWGQIPVRKIQYQEGHYNLWSYTNWMNNFGPDNMFMQRFYFSPATRDTWLVTSNATLDSVNGKNWINVSLALNRIDKSFSPVMLKDVEVKIYDGKRELFSKEMRTGLDGSLKFNEVLKDWVNGKRIKAQITSLDPIDTNKVIQVPLIISRSTKIDLQFLPEGGKLVAGLKSTVGFKAIGEDGRGTFVAGSVYDSKGNKVADFKALHNGMGKFELTPKTAIGSLQSGPNTSVNTDNSVEAYTARVTEPAGITEEFELPKVERLGAVIHISNPEQADKLKITLAGLGSIPLDSGIAIIGTARGKLCYAEALDVNQTELKVDKSLFPTGIVRFTLFKGTTPLNERTVYIDHQDQLQINIKHNKAKYAKRDSVNLIIEVKDKNGDPVRGNFSLSVTDDSQTKADTLGDNDIAANLLNNSVKGYWGAPKQRVIYLDEYINKFLKGNIESPGYYINRGDDQAWEALDNLMLTQGWTDYAWDRIFAADKKPYAKAQNSYDITGLVRNAFRKPIANAPVWLFSQKPAFTRQAVTGEDGRFVFKDLLKIDTASYFIQPFKSNGKSFDWGDLVVDRPRQSWIFPPSINYPIMPWYVNADSVLINLAKLRVQQNAAFVPKNAGTILREVKIKDKKIIVGSWNEFGPGKADYIFDENDIKKSGLTNLYDFLSQKIPGLRFLYGTNAEGNPMICVRFRGIYIFPKINLDEIVINDITREEKRKNNGIEADPIEELSKFQLTSIKGIEFTFSHKYTLGVKAPQIAITTYKGSGNTDWGSGVRRYKHTANSYKPLPVTVPKTFYSPKYQVKSQTNTRDYRSTIHWEPNIVTDKNGRARVSFYTSDSEGGLSFNLQGLSVDGDTGSLLYRLPNKR